jgi:hypothetical protein
MSQNDISLSAMFDQSDPRQTWMSRAVVTIAFLFFGFDKFTGLTEITGAILVLIPPAPPSSLSFPA